ncbi:MAG: hypothetical protein JW769_03640 [Parachlamydiales bacterium]|nr:hypothetical protein [Parachlamydiales bacterium]
MAFNTYLYQPLQETSLGVQMLLLLQKPSLKESPLSHFVPWFFAKFFFLSIPNIGMTLVKILSSAGDAVVGIPTTAISLFPLFTCSHTVNRFAKHSLQSFATLNGDCYFHMLRSIDPEIDCNRDYNPGSFQKSDFLLYPLSRVHQWNERYNNPLTNLISLVTIPILRLLDCVLKGALLPITLFLNIIPFIRAPNILNRYAYTSLNVLLVISDIYEHAIRVFHPNAFQD